MSVTTFLKMQIVVYDGFVQFVTRLLRGTVPAHDYHPDVGLMVVAGEFCGTGSIWCNVETKKTLLSSDAGVTFTELADFAGDGRELTCGVFLADKTWMGFDESFGL